MGPEVIIADDLCDFNRYWIIGCQCPGDKAAPAGGCIDGEFFGITGNLLDFVLFPAMVVTPYDLPASSLCATGGLFDSLLVSKVRNRDTISFPGDVSNGVEVSGEPAD